MKKKSLFLSTMISSCIVALTSGQGSAEITHPTFPTNRMDRGQQMPAQGYGYDQGYGAPLYTPRGSCPGGQCPGGQCPGSQPYGMQPGNMPQGGYGMPQGQYPSQGYGYQAPRYPQSSQYFGSQYGMPGGSSYMQSSQMYGEPQYGTQSRGTSRYQLPGYRYDGMSGQGYGYGSPQGSYYDAPQSFKCGAPRHAQTNRPDLGNGQRSYMMDQRSGAPNDQRYGYAPMGGAYGNGRPYNESGNGTKALQTGSTEQIKGTIQSINRVQYPDGMHTEIVVNTDDGTKKVTLGPSNYLDTQRFKFNSGDKVTLNAYKVGANGQAVYVAQDISRNGNTMQLRDAQRKPTWPERPMNGNTQMQYSGGTGYRY